MRQNTIIKIIPAILTTAFLLTGCSGSSADADISIPVNKMDTCNTLMYSSLTQNEKSCYEQLIPGFQSFQEKFKVTGSTADIEKAYKALVADRPDLYQVDGYVFNTHQRLFSQEEDVIVYPNYSCTAADYVTAMETTNEKIDSWIKEFGSTADSYGISEFLFKKIAEEGEYDKRAPHGQEMSSIFTYGRAVCGGYAKAYCYALQRAGIPCVAATGELNEVSHAWDIALIGSEYYMSDPTNGDAAYTDGNKNNGKYVEYGYLNMDPALTEGYIPDEEYKQFEIKGTQYEYFNQHGCYLGEYSRDQAEVIINNARRNDEEMVSIQFGSDTAFSAAVKDLFENKYIQDMLPGDGEISYVTAESVNTVTVFLPKEVEVPSQPTPKPSQPVNPASEPIEEQTAEVPVEITVSEEGLR